MTEFTNFAIDSSLISSIEGKSAACLLNFGKKITKDKESNSDQVIFKPLVKEIVHGSTFDRVFFRSKTFKNDKHRCSGGIIMPKAFLNLMSPE